ncbi:TetR/AcrR family transcriptional regulator [Herpetosiphon geysericola]|uniref:HTH tetR-type domain-containing protein n=1 Tax=Herpetosiphon geysericola TaxID=70996 RepID=A0A0P6XX22_9CHLR|nr:TetR/AcrR family transcriptional regulator [Herpetosiphon geysericola]KPL80302.1 hypothetical protein SE18_24970 [Herpetosiphon geysericola]
MLGNAVKIDPRAKRTRKLILDALIQLLRTRTFEEVTVNEIAEAATINRATFYAHFSDKYALVDELIRDGFMMFLDRRMQHYPDTPTRYMQALLWAIADHWAMVHGQCNQYHRFFDSLAENQIKRMLEQHIQTWLDHYSPLRSVPAMQRQLLATMLSWSVYALAARWLYSDRCQNLESFINDSVPLLVGSIEALKG